MARLEFVSKAAGDNLMGRTGANLGKKNMPVFVDVFAGCGGLSLGLMRSGWHGLFAIEKDSFAFDTLQTNFLGDQKYRYHWPKWLEKRPWCIEELLNEHHGDLTKLAGRIDLLAGGPPCQGFSSAGRRKNDDPRNSLFERYLDLVELLRPKVVLIENVLGITYDFKVSNGKRRKGPPNFARELEKRLDENYLVETSVIHSAEFGVPQSRPRFFLVGVSRDQTDQKAFGSAFQILIDNQKDFLAAKNLPRIATARSALSDLCVTRNGTVSCPETKGYSAISYRGPLTKFQRAMREGHNLPPSDTRLAKHCDEVVERFEKIISECKAQSRLNVLLSEAMRREIGLGKHTTRVLDPNQPAPTITSMPDDLLHYSEPRTLTVRENARLQTFPDWFRFRGKFTTGGHLRRKEVPRFTQVANAVPPLLAEQIGNAILEAYCNLWGRRRKMMRQKKSAEKL